MAGFSMGGGKVARYRGKYGSKGVSKTVFVSSIPPCLLKTPDNPEGVDGSVFEGIKKDVAADRYAFFPEFFKSATGLRSAKLIKGDRLTVVKDGPHCITWTHARVGESAQVKRSGTKQLPNKPCFEPRSMSGEPAENAPCQESGMDWPCKCSNL